MAQSEGRRITFRKHYAKLRVAIFAILGSRCVKCGFDDLRALQIDHINGGGSKQRKGLAGRDYHRAILDELLGGSSDYQILCANCNWIKRAENNENRTKL